MSYYIHFRRNCLVFPEAHHSQKILRKHLHKESEGLDHALKHTQMKSIRLNNFDIDGAIESRK